MPRIKGAGNGKNGADLGSSCRSSVSISANSVLGRGRSECALLVRSAFK